MTELTALAVRLIPCAYCKAPPGRFCQVAAGYATAGARSSYVHTARSRIVYDTWRLGYFEGLADAIDVVERAASANPAIRAVDVLPNLRRWL